MPTPGSTLQALHKLLLVFCLCLAALAATGDGPTDASQTLARPAHAHGHDHTHIDEQGEIICVREPQMPSLLQVERSAADGDRLTVRVLPGIDGNARLNVSSPAAVQWDNAPAAAGLRLQKRGAAREFGMRVGKAGFAGRRKVTVSLVIEDEQGQPSITMQEEVTLDGDIAEPDEMRPSVEVSGISAQGSAVMASIPLNAPEPVDAGVAR